MVEEMHSHPLQKAVDQNYERVGVAIPDPLGQEGTS